MSNTPSVKASEFLNIDPESTAYRLMGALEKSDTLEDFIAYVEAASWTIAEKTSVCLTAGASMHDSCDEKGKAEDQIRVAMLGLAYAVANAPAHKDSLPEEKLACLATIQNASELVDKAAELECDLDQYVTIGMLIALL